MDSRVDGLALQRPTKFRAWDLVNKKWLDLARLALSEHGELVYANDTDDLCLFDETDYVIVQSTGLLDGKQREIYVGDIITWGELAAARGGTVNFVVEYDTRFGSFGFRGTLGLQPFTWAGSNYLSVLPEVIGNIYENRDLLETK